jgi:hypothetical protein
MRFAFYLLVALIGAYYAHDHYEMIAAAEAAEQAGGSEILRAFEEKRSAHQVSGAGAVLSVLPDDSEASRQQRFIVGLPSGQTVLIAHNIDLSARIESIRPGDKVTFYGEYEWNEEGGVVHRTQRNAQGEHVAGWIEHNGRRYR